MQIKRVNFNFNAERNLEILSKAAFLTTKSGNKINTMVIGWGTTGVMWRMPVFIAMVRKCRFTYELLEKSREFTVTFPYADMPQAVQLCGSKSGRNKDKLALCGLKTLPGQKIDTPVLDVPGMHYECKIVYDRLMGPEKLDKALNELWYNKTPDDYHVFYIAEIVDSYLTD